MRRIHLLLVLVGHAAGFALLAGCASPSTANTTVPVAEAQPFAGLVKGMTAAEVRALLGEPEARVPGEVPTPPNETWTYTRVVRTTTTQAATGVRQIDTVDPISGREFTMPEPVMQTVNLREIETARLLFIDGRLIEWQTKRESTRNY